MTKYTTSKMLLLASAILLLPLPGWAQHGTGREVKEASHPPLPLWPKLTEPPQGAPNVVLILVDDAGFSATSTFGGEANTPNFTKLAACGLRYNEFAVNPICSPTRAALLSGRNNHQIGFGTVPSRATPYPGYNSIWPKSAASIAEILRENGYNTAAFGKWHNTPMWESGPTGPFDHWPTSLGFQHFYGFVNGWDNQYYPRLFDDRVPVEPAGENYDLTDDLTNHAIDWLHEVDAVDPNKPFFLYFATGATHWPLQVPKKWIAKYKGRFNAGWDVLRQQTFERQKKLGVIPADAELTPRPEGFPAWNSLTPDQKKLMERQAEVYAAYAEQADFDIGRLLTAIDKEGKTRNTLVIEIFGDNGGSAEGGIFGTDAFNVEGKRKTIHERVETADELGSDTFIDFYAAGWAWEQSTPFQGTKLDASHLGGTRDPMVISWPARIHDPGGLRTQFQHITDIAPTIYEAAGIQFPKTVNGVAQIPLAGISMIYTFNHPNAPSRHHIQYFASEGSRGIYKDGWWAGDPYRYPWETAPRPFSGEQPNLHPWELYNLNNDYSQAHDLAKQDPQKLKQMIQLFDEEAKRNQVYPLLQTRMPLPTPAAGRTEFTYRSGVDRLTSGVVPMIVGRAHQITANVIVGKTPAQGVIVTQGGRYGGFSLFAKNGYVIYAINAFGNPAGELVSHDRLKPGLAHIVLDVVPDPGDKPGNFRPGQAMLQVNGVSEGRAKFLNLVGRQHGETLDIGKDLGTSPSSDYTVPDPFNGAIDEVKIDLK